MADQETLREILDIVNTAKEEDYNRILDEKASWDVVKELSHIRENILGAMELTGTEKVLEVGSGSGAVTGALLRRAGSVTCLEPSKELCEINAARHRDAMQGQGSEKLQILQGSLTDLQDQLDAAFDVITLVDPADPKSLLGNLQGDTFAQLLSFLEEHLAERGRLVIAADNRLGLRYFAGCREAHTGFLFEGLENYPDQDQPLTLSKAELTAKLKQAGFESLDFYYPYPDHVLPLAIYSDERLPGSGELNINNWNFDRERVVLFDEQKVYDSLVAEDQFPTFANSFLVIAHKEEAANVPAADASPAQKREHIIYTKFSNERSRETSLRTDILLDEKGEKKVRKMASYPEGKAHIASIAKHGEELEQLFKDTDIRVNHVLTSDAREGSVTLEFITGERNLEQKLSGMLRAGKREEAFAILQELTGKMRQLATEDFRMTEEFVEYFGHQSFIGAETQEEEGSNGRKLLCMPVTDLDMVAENFVVDDGLTLIDYEWTVDFPVPVDFVIFRTWHYFFARLMSDEVEQELLAGVGFTNEQARQFLDMEQHYQNKVEGRHVPLRSMYTRISPGLRDMKAEMNLDRDKGSVSIGSLSWSMTGDFTDVQSVPVVFREEADGTFAVTMDLTDAAGAKALRWDPLEGQLCRFTLEQTTSLGLAVLTPENGFREGGVDSFWTMDPVYRIGGDLEGAKELTIRGRVQRVSIGEALSFTTQTKLERDAYFTEMNNLRSYVSATKATKAFMAIEGVRRGRNFVMARVRGTHLFRDRNAGSKKYQGWFAEHQADAATIQAQRIAQIPGGKKISLIVPTYKTPEKYLREMIDSVRNQTYTNWQLCLGDGSILEDGSHDQSVVKVLQEYAKADPRIVYSLLDKNEGISGNTNAAAKLADGDYIALLDHDDLLAPNALYEMALAAERTGAQFLYSDEDKVSMIGVDHFDPNLKPDFSPDLLRTHNYITHLALIDRKLFEQVGGFRSAFDGAQDYDLFLRISEIANKIVHVPKILYFWRMHPGSTAENPKSKMYAYEAGRKALEEHLQRIGRKGTVEIAKLWGMYRIKYDTPADPLVSILIPNKDHIDDLDKCIRSIQTKSDYKNLEFVIIENNSTEAKTFAYYEKLKKEDTRVKVVTWDGPFNYSAINNFGAKAAKGELYLLLNNDTELMEPGSIREMVGQALQKTTGCVGAKLLFADNTVQHAGIVLGFGGFAGHVFSGLKKDDPGFMMRARSVGNFCAVTAACLMIRKDVFEQVNGLDEQFVVALNDVDFCLRVREAGYLNVYTPYSLWHHYESKSRGYEDTPEKKARFEGEIRKFRDRWGETVDAGDPYYNVNLSYERAPFTLWS